MKARHQRARSYSEMSGQTTDGAERRREPRDCFEEEPRLFGWLAEGRDQPCEDPRGNRRRGMTNEVPQSPPSVGLGAINGRSHTRRTEPQQCFGGFAVVARDQRDSRDRGKFTHEPRDRRERLTVAAMDRNDHRIDAPAPGYVKCFTQRFGVQCMEAAVARGVDARAFGRGKNSADGDHAATLTLGYQTSFTAPAPTRPTRESVRRARPAATPPRRAPDRGTREYRICCRASTTRTRAAL